VYGIALAANIYRNELLSADVIKQEFYFLSPMAAAVTVRKLRPLDDITSIPLPREILLADFEQVIGLIQVELAVQAESVATR